MEIKRTKTKKTYEQVAERIKALIEQGELEPGQKLSPLYELAKQFGVSRATVREAFSSLVGMGLIDLRHGEGTFVRRIDVQTMVTEPMNAALLLGRGDLRELLEVRRLLEIGLVQRACERGTDEMLLRIEAALYPLSGGAQSAAERADHDLRFHLAIAEAARNTVLLNLMYTLSEPIRSLLRERYEDPAVASEAAAKHRPLCEAILERDSQRAALLMQMHLVETERYVERLKRPDSK